MTTTIAVVNGIGTQYGRLAAYDRAAVVSISGLASAFYGVAVTGILATADGATALAAIVTGTVSGTGTVSLTFDLDTATMATLMSGRADDGDAVLTVYATATESNACIAVLKVSQASDHGLTTAPTSATAASLAEAQALVDAHNAAADAHSGVLEPALGNPTGSTKILQSTTDGLRSWVAAGTGDVVGPAGATDARPALFDGVTGKLLKQHSAALGTAAAAATGDFATAAQGGKADSALQPAGNGSQLTGITASQVGAEATQTPASQAEMEAGTEAGIRSMSPLRVAQAIAALAEGGGGLVSVLAECTAESFAWPNANWTNYSKIGSFSTTERMPRYLLDSAREEPWLMPQAFAIPTGATGLRFVVCYKPEATCDGSKVAWTSRYIKCTDNAAWGNEVETTLGFDTLPASGTAPQIYSVDKTLAELSLSVGDHVRFWMARDGDDGTNDTFAADVGLYWCKIEAY